MPPLPYDNYNPSQYNYSGYTNYAGYDPTLLVPSSTTNHS